MEKKDTVAEGKPSGVTTMETVQIKQSLLLIVWGTNVFIKIKATTKILKLFALNQKLKFRNFIPINFNSLARMNCM